MSGTLRGKAAIVGVADLASPTGELELHGRALEIAMIEAALDDAGLSIEDVDGVCHTQSSMVLAEYLRIVPRWTETTMTGGSSFEVHAEHAAAAIASGLCEVVVSVYASTPRSDRKRSSGEGRVRRPGGGGGNDAAIEFEVPYGLRAPIAPYALAANRHMHEFGTTGEQLAAIAVQTRRWASMNPQARHRDPITVDDVLASPYQVAPLHTLDCCLVTDGAGAFVMTSAERAKSLRKPPVYVLGAATAHDHASAISGDARPHDDPRRDQRAERVPHGRRRTRRRRRARGLRQLHDHRPPPPRGPRLLLEGRGRSVRCGGAHRAGRLCSDEHSRRRALVHPSRHVRHVLAHRSRPSSSAASAANARSRARRSPSPTEPASSCRACRRSSSERRRRCEPSRATPDRGEPAVLGRRRAKSGCCCSGASTARCRCTSRESRARDASALDSSTARHRDAPPCTPSSSSTDRRRRSRTISPMQSRSSTLPKDPAW